MSATSFHSFLPQVRDRGMKLQDSWQQRYGSVQEPERHYHEITAIRPLYRLTTAHILHFLIAAAANREATHLELHVFPAIPLHAPWVSPQDKIEDLMCSFEDKYGFEPFELGTNFENADNDYIVTISLFSEKECTRALSVLHKTIS